MSRDTVPGAVDFSDGFRLRAGDRRAGDRVRVPSRPAWDADDVPPRSGGDRRDARFARQLDRAPRRCLPPCRVGRRDRPQPRDLLFDDLGGAHRRGLPREDRGRLCRCLRPRRAPPQNLDRLYAAPTPCRRVAHKRLRPDRAGRERARAATRLRRAQRVEEDRLSRPVFREDTRRRGRSRDLRHDWRVRPVRAAARRRHDLLPGSGTFPRQPADRASRDRLRRQHVSPLRAGGHREGEVRPDVCRPYGSCEGRPHAADAGHDSGLRDGRAARLPRRCGHRPRMRSNTSLEHSVALHLIHHAAVPA